MAESLDHLSGDTIVDKIVGAVGVFARWLCLLLVLLQFSVVVARYLFETGSVMAQESILFTFGSMFMLALADALKNGRHVRVDMIFHGLSSRAQRRVDAIGIVVFLLPLCVYMLLLSWPYVSSSWAALEGSREAGGLPGVFLLKTVILIALVLVIAQSLVILNRCIQRWSE
ncbi:TRAP transporter small permease subunit [Pacificoceanicola onchidii]|uniref:TRAP transporter small permease subunit n=1 Tax=Pacificoceanicola onchidii TaxID=2562685 RepID=UPI001455E0E0|nr:TRAP transporter small permease subunit [Pacificoceanicola onchidii]